MLDPKQTYAQRFNANGKRLVRVLSYNIWFATITQKRMDALLSVIEDADADFVCLQEVTH